MQSRPSLTLRRPSATSASPEAVAAFVQSGDDSEAQPDPSPAPPSLRAVPLTPASISTNSAAPSFRRASRAVVPRRTRPARRRTTIYFDVEVAIDLSGLLTERDQELSDVVNTVVRDWLAQERKR
jgi:hypothetical protein